MKTNKTVNSKIKEPFVRAVLFYARYSERSGAVEKRSGTGALIFCENET